MLIQDTCLQIQQEICYNEEGTALSGDTRKKIEDVKQFIKQIDANECENNRGVINRRLAEIFKMDGWEKEEYIDKEGGDLHRVDFLGHRIAVEIQFGKNPTGDIAKIQALHDAGKIDCGILVLASPVFAKV